MVAILGFNKEQITEAVQQMYATVAKMPDAGFHFPVGRAGCRVSGYPDEVVDPLPPEAVASFAGVGYPFWSGLVKPGDTVLDIGSGAGVDTLIAARLVGPAGKVYALDVTPAMVAKLERVVAEAAPGNVQVLEGTAERIPLPDESVDVITSNGVLNLVPDKRLAMREMFRVLRPGGRVQIADIVIKRPVTPDCLGDPKLWAECVVGATVDEDYLDMFRDAGFEDVEIIGSHDYFAHSPSAETRDVARSFDARAIEITMRRRAAAPHWALVLVRRVDPRRVARQLGRRGLWGVAALILAMAACYGTLGALGILAVLGVSATLNEGAWAAAIVALAAAAALVVGLGIRKHGKAGPSALAVAGALLIVYVMGVRYDFWMEAAGFALLAGGVAWDYRIRRYLGSPRSPNRTVEPLRTNTHRAPGSAS